MNDFLRAYSVDCNVSPETREGSISSYHCCVSPRTKEGSTTLYCNNFNYVNKFPCVTMWNNVAYSNGAFLSLICTTICNSQKDLIFYTSMCNRLSLSRGSLPLRWEKINDILPEDFKREKSQLLIRFVALAKNQRRGLDDKITSLINFVAIGANKTMYFKNFNFFERGSWIDHLIAPVLKWLGMFEL